MIKAHPDQKIRLIEFFWLADNIQIFTVNFADSL